MQKTEVQPPTFTRYDLEGDIVLSACSVCNVVVALSACYQSLVSAETKHICVPEVTLKATA